MLKYEAHPAIPKYSKAISSGKYIVVTIKNYRSHESSQFFFPINKATYVCGPNGAGKSNIYYAIEWALYRKKNDRIHFDDHTSSTVIVKLEIGTNIVVIRKACPNTIYIKYNKKEYTEEDAENMIVNVFGTHKMWKFCSSYDDRINQFVGLSPAQKVEVLNELVGNDEGVKKKISELVSQAKTDKESAKRKLDYAEMEYKAKYKKEVPNEKLILKQSKVKDIEKRIQDNTKSLSSIEKKEKKRNVLELKVKTLQKTLTKLEKYNQTELDTLTALAELNTVYQPLLQSYNKATLELRKYFKKDVPTVLNDDPVNAAVQEKQYNTNIKIAKDCDVEYNKDTIQKTIVKLEHSLTYPNLAEKIKEYSEAERKYKLSVVDGTLPTEIPNKIKLYENEITRLEYDLSFTSLREKHKEIRQLAKDIETKRNGIDFLKKPLPESDFLKTPLLGSDNATEQSDRLASFIKDSEYTIENQWVFGDREKYEKALTNLPNNIKQEIETTSISSLIDNITQTIADINSAKTAIGCPHCQGLLKYVKGKLIKFDGTIVNGDTDILEETLGKLRNFSKLKYPNIPEGVEKVNVVTLRKNVEKARECVILINKLEKEKKNCKPLPEDISPTLDESSTRKRITACRNAIKKLTDYKFAHESFSKLIQPVLPEGVKLLTLKEITSATDRLKKLKSINIIEKPLYTSTALSSVLMYNKAKQLLDEVEVPSKEVDNSSIIEYASLLRECEKCKEDMKSTTEKLSELSNTGNKLLEIKECLVNDNKTLSDSTLHKAMLKMKENTEKATNRYDETLEELETLEEFKNIYDKDCKNCVIDRMRNIQSEANGFLSSLDTENLIQVRLDYNDGIKITAIKNGSDKGKPSNLSSGEETLINMAITVAFSLQSKSNIVIFDEITDKLSDLNKDHCVEALLNIMTLNKKTVIVSDHHYYEGNYDSRIRLYNVQS